MMQKLEDMSSSRLIAVLMLITAYPNGDPDLIRVAARIRAALLARGVKQETIDNMGNDNR